MIFPRPAATAFLALVFLCAHGGAPVRADEKPVPGHSASGEAFNEGPRQAAVLMPGMGAVEFPVTTKSELAQKFFTQGVGQLHGFWYFEAERSFRQASALDPECAMAYWGMAMANIDNPKRAADFMKLAVAKKGPTRREELWIKEFCDYYADGGRSDDGKRKALVRAMEELIYEFPADLEAKAFLVFQLWDNSQHGLPLSSRLAVDALAKQILAANPMECRGWRQEGAGRGGALRAGGAGHRAHVAHAWPHLLETAPLRGRRVAAGSFRAGGPRLHGFGPDHAGADPQLRPQ